MCLCVCTWVHMPKHVCMCMFVYIGLCWVFSKDWIQILRNSSCSCSGLCTIQPLLCIFNRNHISLWEVGFYAFIYTILLFEIWFSFAQSRTMKYMSNLTCHSFTDIGRGQNTPKSKPDSPRTVWARLCYTSTPSGLSYYRGNLLLERLNLL